MKHLLSFIAGAIVALAICIPAFDCKVNNLEIELQDSNERVRGQTLCHNYCINMLHDVWQYDQNFWLDVITETDSYWDYTELIHNDWEDFYCEW